MASIEGSFGSPSNNDEALMGLPVSLDMVKVALGLDLTNDTYDDLLTAIINGVAKDFEKLSGRQIAIGAVEEILDLDRGQVTIYLKAYPVVVSDEQTFSLWLSPSRTFDDSSLVDPSNYYVEKSSGIIILTNYLTGTATAKVSYYAGMAVLEEPEVGQEFWTLYPDVAQAIIHDTIIEYRKLSTLGIASQHVSSDAVTPLPLFDRSPLFKRIAAQYGRVRL
jgi:hypothetical protein